jgi:hypothetical protein
MAAHLLFHGRLALLACHRVSIPEVEADCKGPSQNQYRNQYARSHINHLPFKVERFFVLEPVGKPVAGDFPFFFALISR